MSWGSLIDCLTTTPELVNSEYAVIPQDAPVRPTEAMLKAAKPSQSSIDRQEWWTKFDASAEGKTVISAETMRHATEAQRMLTVTCKASASIFAKSRSQVIVAGRVQGAKLKGLVDLAPEGEDFLADLKTISAFTKEGFAKQIANFGYHMQAGIYLNLWNAMFPKDQRNRWKIIWQDSSPPFEACVTELSRGDIEDGWTYAVSLIDRIVSAAKSDKWPMAFEDEPVITRPVWASIQEEEKRTVKSENQ